MTEELEVSENVNTAKEIYVLMKDEYRISRNIRAQWFLNNLNKVLTVFPIQQKDDCNKEIQIISANPRPSSCDNDGTFQISIVPETKIVFLATGYRIVFCLDLGSSIATVDNQHVNLFLEEVHLALKQSLENVCRPCCIPGSNFLFVPELHITVIAHVPKSPSGLPQVLIQGWILTPENVQTLLDILQKRLCDVIERVTSTFAKANAQCDKMQMSSDSLSSSLHQGSHDLEMSPHLLTADMSALNLLRYGILSLQLLHENSSAGIVVITDGIISFHNAQLQDSLLSQLRNSTISCSFIQIGSPCHPSTSYGCLPYTALMQFISAATCGACFASPVDMYINPNNNEPNAFHEAFLYWSFRTIYIPEFLKEYNALSPKSKYWSVDNPNFYSVANQSRIKKKHAEGLLKVSFENVLSCRLREGYTVNYVSIDEGKNTVEVRLLLPWNLSTNFEYVIKSCLTHNRANSESESPSCHFELIVDGCYEFLHDVTCSKGRKGYYRASVIKQFWSYVKNLSHTDQILIQLHSFPHQSAFYTIPESIKNGVPLSYLSGNSVTPVLTNKSMAHSPFTAFWKPLCMLDINVWQKWMHTQRIGVILQHDTPLPKNLQQPNDSGRYVHIQCRQATTALNTLLTDYSTFVLVENHFYIKFLYTDSDKPPISFYIIRVTSKPPCVVIRLAFLGGLPGYQRNEIVKDLRERISNLKLPKRSSSKELHLLRHSDFSIQSTTCDVNCCFLLKKPIEKILIRYERIPENFTLSIIDVNSNSQRNLPSHKSSENVAASLLIMLSKYLRHQRWVWSMQRGTHSSLNVPSVSKILSVLTRIRLKQGFHFSHSAYGVSYMVMEIPMKVLNNGTELKSGDFYPCVVQYLMFPPHTNTSLKDSTSEEEDSELPESDGELQLITECWIEPQHGTTCLQPSSNLHNLQYDQISETFYKQDWECVSTVTTFEHLSFICQRKDTLVSAMGLASLTAPVDPSNIGTSVAEMVPSTAPGGIQALNAGINTVSYPFNFASLLPKCHQTEFMFPSLYQCHVDAEANNQARALEAQSMEILFEHLLKNIKLIQDKELILSTQDCISFMLQVHHRHRDPQNDPFVPFNHPINIDPKNAVLQHQIQLAPNCKYCLKAGKGIQDVARWRCFLKGYSSSRFLMTFLPASFADLIKLTTVEPQEENDGSSVAEMSPESEQDKQHKEAAPENCTRGQLPMIPIYVYDCALSLVINQLVTLGEQGLRKDDFERYMFKYDDNADCEDLKPEIMEISIEELSKQDGGRHERKLLKNYHSLIDKAFSKSFVYSVYRSLVCDHPIDKSDVMAAIDEICEESLLEVDITEFVYSICGHVKDFTLQQQVRQQQICVERSDTVTSDTSNATSDSKLQHCFPLPLLQKHQPCEQLQQKHLNIKEKFMEILQGFLKKIPSRPDYFVFCLAPDATEESSDEESIHESKADEIVTDPVVQADPIVDKETNALHNAEDVASINSHDNTESSLSSLDDDRDSSDSHGKENLPPLFVHLLCSVKYKQDIKSCSMPSLPTCMSHLLSCIDSETTEIDLEELRITMDITCLTLPSDIENPTMSLDRQYSTSYSSSSPIPDIIRPKSIDREEDSSSDFSETVQGIALRNIPSYQRDGVYKCIDKIKWLLMDEKASAALNSYPITSEILAVVATHVKNAKDSVCCIVKEVPLKFVYGTKSSHEKFMQVFKCLRLSGYHLNEVDDLFYLVLSPELAEKQNQHLGSLNPPLGMAGKYLLMHKNLACDDSTQLKNICDEVMASSRLEDDANSGEFGTPKEFFNKFGPISMRGKSKALRRNLHLEDDTETEDSHDLGRAFSKRTTRRSSGRNDQVEVDLSNILFSTPSLGDSDKSCQLERSSSLPFNLNILDSENDFHSDSAKMGCSDLNANMSKSEPTSMENLAEVDNELETSHAWDLRLCTGNARSVSSAPSTARCKTLDAAESPQFFSDASVFGSCHFSNTEDGYDGDSSDTGSDRDWLSAVESKRPVPPNFWLIMTAEVSKVTIYFHIRHRKKEDGDEELTQSHSVLSQTVEVITNICKEVNQTLLLQDLHDTHFCNPLLEAEESEDIWKPNTFDPLSVTSHDNLRSYSEETEHRYLEANLRFMPGDFKCAIVWTTHFKLHPRLTTGHTGQKSKGIQAFRNVLGGFSVNNRENMFVYQEAAGSVFYLRLYEEICDETHCSSKPKIEINLSPNAATNFSTQSAFQCKTLENENEGDFRPRVNSGHSDGDHQDSVSLVSYLKTAPRCISLFVHGIGEVGSEFKVDLVQALQNRLNDSVLEMIIMMLSRNPLCKLTPEDVQFIQNPNQPPFSEIHFTIPVKLLCYAHSIHMYLRQNMLHFLFNPKYMDNRKENHFKGYSPVTSEWLQVDDNDVFLYHSHQASGYSGSKSKLNESIACIILSLVTGQGHPFEHLGNSLPNPTAYRDGLSENDFEELTLTQRHVVKKGKAPGPVALIKYQIWSVGRESVEHIESRLHDAVRHTLWDLLMEYRVMTAPVTDSSTDEELPSYSEPSTPVRGRRSGRTTVEQTSKLKDFQSPALFSGKEISASVPDIAVKTQSPQPSLQNVFQFNTAAQPIRSDAVTKVPQSAGPSSIAHSPSTQVGESCNLNDIFHSVMKAFLLFGSQLGCPTLTKYILQIPSRHSIPLVLTEIQNLMRLSVRDLHFRVFLRMTNAMTADTEFVPFKVSPETVNTGTDPIKPGTKNNFIAVGRNYKQWKTLMGITDFVRFHESNFESLKGYQKFQTHVCCPTTPDPFQESSPASPTSIGKSNTLTLVSSPRLKSPGIIMPETTLPPSPSSCLFVPRQRLLLMFIEDKQLTVFMYNWSQDIANTFLKQLTKLIEWHEARNSLLNNIISQKLGLFHGQSLPDQQEKNEKEKVPRSIQLGRKVSYPTVCIKWKYAEQLWQHSCPPRDQVTGSRNAEISSLPPVLEILKNTRPPVQLHLSKYNILNDPVAKFGNQIQDIRNAHRKDKLELHSMWQDRNTIFQNPYVDRLLVLLKRAGRLSHYCLTPLLFNPSWRMKVAPIRDHTVQPLDQAVSGLDKSPSESNVPSSRSRHNSGSSLKNVEGTMSVAGAAPSNASRSRRASGAAIHQSTAQSSPKIRMKNPSEETWHQTVCSHYLMDYMQYLQTLGFVSVQTKDRTQGQGKKIANNGDNKYKLSTSVLIRANISGPFHLIRYQLGGLLLFEVGLRDPYAYGHLYTIDSSRLCDTSTRTHASQFTSAFLDEVDKIKSMMHLHSFTYDYHLRTIHSYVSGRQLIFKHGYHLTSFLDDFIKYYQKSPNCARNLLYAGIITITDISMSGLMLYNYIISHNQLYGMTVLRMVPIMQESGLMMHTEFVLVELSARKASYKDSNDVCQMGNFDIGLLINHNTEDVTADKNTLVLNYYIILTSQRELFPKMENFGTTLGSFQTVRFTPSQTSSGFSSRKTSTVSMGNEKDKLESSGEETSSSSSDSRSRRAPGLGITDEEVTYLGYFSSQETMMQEVLKTEASSAQRHLSGVFHRAAVHCRRDYLWNALLPRSFREEEPSSKDSHTSTISYAEFIELLELVSSVPLDDIDDDLKPFLDMKVSWYRALSLNLKVKYAECYREFVSLDQNNHYFVVTHSRCPDSFMLMIINFAENSAELCLVFREPPTSSEQNSDKPSQRILALRTLVEDFVNVCSFQLWSTMIS